MKVLHIGSYWMGSNDIVALMANSLKEREDIIATLIDPKIYSLFSNQFTQRDGQINWIKDEYLLQLINEFNPNLIICNAGGLSPTKFGHKILKERGIITIGIALSDPDDFFVRSKYFSKMFDYFFTNAVKSLEKYKEIGVKAYLLPFAADSNYHFPLTKSEYKYDVVIVGAKRPERDQLVWNLRERGIKVGCYGAGWIDDDFPFNILPKIIGNKISRKILMVFDFLKEVHGKKHNQALNSAPIYISFSATYAGYTNVKVGLFEAAAAGNCVIVEEFDEIKKYFEPDNEIITYKSYADAIEKIVSLTKDPVRMQIIGQNARNKLILQHTWKHRWDYVFSHIK